MEKRQVINMALLHENFFSHQLDNQERQPIIKQLPSKTYTLQECSRLLGGINKDTIQAAIKRVEKHYQDKGVELQIIKRRKDHKSTRLIPPGKTFLVLIGLALARYGGQEEWPVRPWAQAFHPDNLEKTTQQDIEFSPDGKKVFIIKGPELKEALKANGINL